MANNTQCNVEGIGKIRITNTYGKEVILTDVRYMPKMSRNLISYDMLEKAGCNYKGEGFKIHFFKNSEKVFSGDYEDGLYYLQGTVSRAEANVGKAEQNMTELWHSRLGHMSISNMNVLVMKGYLNIKEVGGIEFCENCALGKEHKQSFKKAKHITKGILDYVHSDLWGSPLRVLEAASISSALLTTFLKRSRFIFLNLKMKLLTSSENGSSKLRLRLKRKLSV